MHLHMQLHNQPNPVIHLFGGVTGVGRYSSKALRTRVQLLFDDIRIGGWADDSNGPHWYVLENKQIADLHPSFRVILEHFHFERIPHGDQRHYWRVRGADGMWCFGRAVEEITGIPLLARS